MGYTQIINNPPITLAPFYPSGVGTMLNPLYTVCDPTNGNYFVTTGRDLVTFYCSPAASASAWLGTTLYTAGQVVNFGLTANVTSTGVTSDVLTVTCLNTFQVGESVKIAGLGVSTFLNGLNFTVLTASATQFTATYVTANYGPVAETQGTASIATAAYIALVNAGSNLNVQPTSTAGATFWTTYTDGESNVTLYSAPDGCTGRKFDIDDYTVPLATEINPGVEFLVLPTSTFTQSNKQFQFLASSNLVSVYVRNF